jgi:hypothetical protein
MAGIGLSLTELGINDYTHSESCGDIMEIEEENAESIESENV